MNKNWDWKPNNFLNGKITGRCNFTNNAIVMTKMGGAFTGIIGINAIFLRSTA